MSYALHLLIITGLFGLLGMSLQLIAGQGGMLSLVHGALFGLGAYAFALISPSTSDLASIGAAIVVPAAVAGVISFVSRSVHDDYFAVLTFGWQVVLIAVLSNMVRITGGPLGISGIEPITAFGVELGSSLLVLVAVVVLAGLIYAFLSHVAASPFGRVLRTVGEDEILARSLGKRPDWSKVRAFSVGGGIAGLTGAVYASYVGYIDPSSFSVDVSILIFTVVAIGGFNSLRGSLGGAALLVLVPEVIRFLGLSQSYVASLRQVVFGLFLVLVVVYRPEGLVPKRQFRG